MFAAQNDSTCPVDTNAKVIKDEIGDAVKQYYVIDSVDHEYFLTANDHQFIENLTSQLTESSAVLKSSIILTSFTLFAAMLA